MLVIGEGKRTVNRKEQWCYIVCIPEIDDETEFHIVKFNFSGDYGPQNAISGRGSSRTPVTSKSTTGCGCGR